MQNMMGKGASDAVQDPKKVVETLLATIDTAKTDLESGAIDPQALITQIKDAVEAAEKSLGTPEEASKNPSEMGGLGGGKMDLPEAE